MSAKKPRDKSTFPLDIADQCVKCGLCLPHCPTYEIEAIEGDSPRGRIALMQGLASDALEPGTSLKRHLNQCLGCRACESVCPSRVPFGALMDAGRRELTRLGHGPGLIERVLLNILSSRRLVSFGAAVLRIYQRLRLDSLIRRFMRPNRGVGRADSLLPKLVAPSQWREFYPATSERCGRVALFLGCVAPGLDPRTTQDAIRVLTTLGFDVCVPKNQGCCGAVHQHAGLEVAAQEYYQANLNAFSDAEIVLVSASGCAATLIEYDTLVEPGSGNRTAANEFSMRVRDLNSFVADHLSENPQHLGGIGSSVAVHEPCTVRNVLKNQADTYRLLEFIEGLNVRSLPGNTTCCGAAGTFMVTQPRLARRLGSQKHAHIFESTADITVTSNIGCALVLGARPENGKKRATVVHPISLLAQALRQDE